MIPKWFLIETFGPEGPSVIGVGDSPRPFIPLTTLFRRHSSSLADVQGAIGRATVSRVASELLDGDRRIIGVPLISFAGHVHGVYVWIGAASEEPPRRDPAGAWHFNLTTDVIGGSGDLLDLYGVPTELRQETRHTAEAFTRLLTNTDVAAAMALIVRSQVGDEHQATWTVVRDDQVRRAAHFSLRAVMETNSEGQNEVVLHGISHDLGPADEIPAAPPPIVLEQRLLQSIAEPGQYRAIVNLKNFRIMQWLDEPMPGLGWQKDAANPLPWIHDGDLPAALAITKGLATSSKTTGNLRLRSDDGTWRQVSIVANLILLDENTTAALFTMTNTE